MTSVAVASDHTVQRGGAERVTLAILRAFPGAPLHTSFYDEALTYPEFADVDIRASPLNRITPLRARHRMAFPLFAPMFSAMRPDADVVLCSSTGWAHGVRTDGVKVVYCHNPPRWLFQADQYLPPGLSLQRAAVGALRPSLLRWDRRAAATAARYLANSTVVRGRIRAAYGFEAEVLPPPHTIDAEGAEAPVPGIDDGFVLCVSRLLRYKNVHAVVAAFERLPERRLVVVGTGPDAEEVAAAAPANVTLLGTVTDEQLRWLYRRSAALVAASYEDYGLTPVEAAAFGRPSALLRWGGFLDTGIEGTTGVFFDEPEPAAIAGALDRLLAEWWDPAALVAHASRFTEPAFAARLREVVAEVAR